MKWDGLNNKISRLPKRIFVITTAASTAALCISFITNGVTAPIPTAKFLKDYRSCFAEQIAANKVLPSDQVLSPLEIQIGCQAIPEVAKDK